MYSKTATRDTETEWLPSTLIQKVANVNLELVNVTVQNVDSEQRTPRTPGPGPPEDGDCNRVASDKVVDTAQPGQAMFKSDKWAAALERLSHEDRERFNSATTAQSNAHDVLLGVLEATRRKKDECMDKRWKVVIKGRSIVLRDVVDKISVWVSKVIVRTFHNACQGALSSRLCFV